MSKARWSGSGGQSLPRYPCRNRQGNFEVRWTERDPDTGRARTRSYSFGTADRARADAEYRLWLAAEGAVKNLSAAQPGDTLASLADKYLRSKSAAGRRVSDTTERALGRVLERLGKTAPTELTDFDLEQYRVSRERLVSGPTVRRELGALIALLNWGKRARHIPRDTELPFVELPEEGRPRTRTLTEAEADVVWAAAEALALDMRLPRAERRTGLFVCVAMETAARAASIEKLRVDQIDLGVGIIDFRDLARRRQTTKRRVPVPISKKLLPLIRTGVAEAQLNGDPYLLAGGVSTRAGWGKFRVSVGMPEITRHDLRRTWATLRAQRGVPMDQIAAVLGDSLATTTKHYAHLNPDYLRNAVNS